MPGAVAQPSPGDTWDNDCSEKGCLMFHDVLVGDPDHPADPKNPEHITIAVAIDRASSKPANFDFLLPANADKDQGVIVTFAKTIKDGANWKIQLDKDLLFHLAFAECAPEGCITHISNGVVQDQKTGTELNLIDKFQDSDFILFLYTRAGQPYRAMGTLLSFKPTYQELLATKLK
jgi:hypothetical protein